MANQKISEMQKVFTTKPSDLLYVVQDGVSSNMFVGDFFGKVPDMLLSGSLQLDTIESVVSNGGEISDSHVVTALTVDNMDRTFIISEQTVDDQLPRFMVKVLYVKTSYGGKAVIANGFAPKIQSISLDQETSTAILLSTPLGWIVLGGTGITINYN